MKSIIFIFIFFVSCCNDDDDYRRSLLIENTTGERMYFWYSHDYSMYHYPQFTLPLEKPLFISSVQPNGGTGAYSESTNWQNIYSQLPEGKFSIYFFDEYASTQEEWDDIRENHMVLRKDITLEELRSTDCTIYYP